MIFRVNNKLVEINQRDYITDTDYYLAIMNVLRKVNFPVNSIHARSNIPNLIK